MLRNLVKTLSLKKLVGHATHIGKGASLNKGANFEGCNSVIFDTFNSILQTILLNIKKKNWRISSKNRGLNDEALLLVVLYISLT